MLIHCACHINKPSLLLLLLSSRLSNCERHHYIVFMDNMNNQIVQLMSFQTVDLFFSNIHIKFFSLSCKGGGCHVQSNLSAIINVSFWRTACSSGGGIGNIIKDIITPKNMYCIDWKSACFFCCWFYLSERHTYNGLLTYDVS